VVSAGDRGTGGIVTGQGSPLVAGTTTAPGCICRSASLTWLPVSSGAGTGPASGSRLPLPFSLVRALRRAMARIAASAVSRVWRCRPSQVRAWDWSQPKASFPVLNVVSIGHR
jgi:hypothetical protein